MPIQVGSRSHLVTFLLIAFGWSWTFWWPLALQQSGIIELPAPIRILLLDGSPAAWGPLIAALLVANQRAGILATRAIFASMVNYRFPLRWYVVALFFIPAIVGTGTAVAFLSGDTPPTSDGLSNPLSLPIAFVWILFLGGPLQEEAGWRATLTSDIEQKTGALWASMLAGVVWGTWHLPLFFMPRAEIYYNQPIWGLMLSTLLLSVLLTWVYNNTNRSLLAVMLMHTSWNWSNFVFTGLHTDTGALAFLILTAISVMAVAVWFGPKRLVRT